MVHMPNDEAINELNGGSFLRAELFPAPASPTLGLEDKIKSSRGVESTVPATVTGILDIPCSWANEQLTFEPLEEAEVCLGLKPPQLAVCVSHSHPHEDNGYSATIAGRLGDLCYPPAVTTVQFEEESPYSPPSTPLLEHEEDSVLGTQRFWGYQQTSELPAEPLKATFAHHRRGNQSSSSSEDYSGAAANLSADSSVITPSLFTSVEQTLLALPEEEMADHALSALALLLQEADGSGSGSDGGSWHEGDGSIGEDSEDVSDDLDWPTSFCVNCTAPSHSRVCEDCGHDATQDDSLFCSTAVREPVDTQSGPLLSVLVYDECMTEHEEGKVAPHPERPDRIRAVMSRLVSSGLADRCIRPPCREATKEEIAACHSTQLIESVELASTSAKADEGGAPQYFTPDTYVNSQTYLCARLAAGGCVVAATAVARGEAPSATAIVRPPGHHAESGMAMGFCFFNNAGIAARAAQSCGAKKVLILDWDVHHGNGTQHIFDDDPTVLYMSIHRHDGGGFYPGTGAATEVGEGRGKGFTVNLAWDQSGMHDGDYLAAFHRVVLPIAYEFDPDMIIVSAGFDAAEGDPIGGCSVSPEGFAHMTSLLKGVAPLVVLLEGGYNLTATAQSVEAVLRVILGERPPRLTGKLAPSRAGMLAVHETTMAQAKYWKCMRTVYWMSAMLGQDSGGLLVNNPTVGAAVNGDVDHVCPLEPAAQAVYDHKRKQSDDASVSEKEMDRLIKRQRLAKFYQTTHRKWNLLNALHFVALKALVKKQKAAKLTVEGAACKSPKNGQSLS